MLQPVTLDIVKQFGAIYLVADNAFAEGARSLDHPEIGEQLIASVVGEFV
ncbi:hypothetical protein [Laceyella putida]|uniref:Uncharacterized protein n=1 Tax=Laceyella putida TaxID=110101 RepID=A0ABW2RPH8_9BACL